MANRKKTGRFEKGEIAQIEEAYRQVSNVQTEKPKKKRTFLKVLLILLVLLGLGIGGYMAFNSYYDGPPLIITSKTLLKPGVNIGGVDIGGMNKDAAMQAVQSAFGDYETKPVTVQVMDQSVAIEPAVSGAGLDAETIVMDAFTYGTSKHPGLSMDIMSYLQLNESAIRGKVAELAVHFPTEGTEAGWKLEEKEVDGEKVQVLVVDMGTDYYDFDENALFELVMEAYQNYNFTVEYSCNQLNESTVDLDAVYAQTCTEAVDAVLDPDTREVTQSAVGHRFDLDKAKEALAKAKRGETLEFTFFYVEPSMTTEKLQSMLFRDKLATYTATASSQSGRNTNLKLACKAIDGTILYPGDTFSYNGTVGERTTAKGYKAASAYMNGETVQTVGGGVCQPSSVLYYCTLLADLEIVERRCHSYVSSYMPKGMDATVSWGGPDFKFKNNTDYPIRIDASASGGSVTVTLVGTDEKDYYVKMEGEVLSKTSPKTVEKKVKANSGHKDGEVATTAYTGYTVQTYKCKYDKDTDKLISREKEAYSVYSKRDKVVYRVIQEAKPESTTSTKPTESAPAETTPPDTGAGEATG